MPDCDPRLIHRFPPHPEAGLAWRRAQETTPAPHPAPEVMCRLATAEEVPRAAAILARAAEARGWLVAVTYSRGTRLGARGEPLGAPADCIVVRGRRGDEWIAGGWVATKPGEYAYESGLYLRGATIERLGARELAGKVKSPSPDMTKEAI